jgi:hypothetical protein
MLGSLLLLMIMTACQGLTISSRYTGNSPFGGGGVVLHRQPTVFMGSAVVERSFHTNNNDAYYSHGSITMRKQKASDRRTRRRQRGEIALDDAPVLAVTTTTTLTTTTTNPMQNAAWKHKSGVMQSVQVAPTTAARRATPVTGGGRGRSRKRTTLYQTLQHYHSAFLHPLTAEYQAEVRLFVRFEETSSSWEWISS